MYGDPSLGHNIYQQGFVMAEPRLLQGLMAL